MIIIIFSHGNITPLFCTASLCFLVKLCTQCLQMTMAQRLLDIKRVNVMGNRDYSYSFPNWKRTHAIDHVPPYDYAPILSKAFFLQQKFPTPPITKKEKENSTPMQNSRENAILGSEKRETPSRATDYALARASATVGETKKKRGMAW